MPQFAVGEYWDTLAYEWDGTPTHNQVRARCGARASFRQAAGVRQLRMLARCVHPTPAAAVPPPHAGRAPPADGQLDQRCGRAGHRL